LTVASPDTITIHPEHNRVAQTVKGWFHLPFLGMGYLAERRRWGTYWNNAQVYTSGFSVTEVEPFVADLREYYSDQPGSIYLHIDDPKAEAELEPALRRAGWKVKEPELYLAHVGPVSSACEIPGLETWPVYESNLGQFAATRLRAYSHSEEAPDPAQIKAEIARWEKELSGTGRGLLAKVSGQPVGIIWWHEEPLDIWINQIGVRIPFRCQGIASELLRQCTEDAYYRGYKSVLLNVASDNVAAMRLYQRMGFHDEVYRHRCYVGRLWEK
jgi:GNAT superfamily N-acetyltransferase